MDRRTAIRALGVAAVAVFAPGLASCYGPAPHGQGYPPQPPYYYDYYYYPHVDVYFQIYTGWYYYRSGGIWWRARQLPPHIHLDRRYRRPITVPDEPPYRQHPRHHETYPAPRDWRPDPRHDREEREYNRHQHEEWLKRWKKR